MSDRNSIRTVGNSGESKNYIISKNPFAEKEGICLAWKDVSFSVRQKNDDSKVILRDVSGMVVPGELNSIMGPSGSGKTSLMNILSGRTIQSSRNFFDVKGTLSWNGNKINLEDGINAHQSSRMIAFVSQENRLLPTVTPREAIFFSARMRLDKQVSDHEIQCLSNVMIHELGLDDCADTYVGGPLLKGLSGGETKRTSIGVELVVNPKIIFLDEPTSGLDSFSALQLMKVLKRLASTGTTILFSIHQPSSSVYNSFDNLILLNRGRVMFHGLSKDAPERQFSVPNNYNPADWMLDVSQMQTIEVLEASGFFQNMSVDLPLKSTKNSYIRDESECKLSKITASGYLLRRELYGLRRNTVPIRARFGVTIVMNLLIGVIYFDIGSKSRDDPSHLQSQFGANVLTLMTCIISTAAPSLVTFPSERSVFIREYFTGHYAVSSYFLSRLVIELILNCCQAFIQAVLNHLCLSLTLPFLNLFLIYFVTALVSNATAVCVGSFVKDPALAMEFLPIVLLPQLFFAGFFIVTDLIPLYLRWARYLCSLFYGVALVLVSEFDNCGEGAEEIACENLLEQVDVDANLILLYWGCLVALFITFRCFALRFLIMNAKKFD